MRIIVQSREGHFNWANPSEVSISTHIRIVDTDLDSNYCNITTEDIVTSNHPADLAYEIDRFLKRMLYVGSEKEIKEFKKFIEDHFLELEAGNARYRIDELEKKKTKINEELVKLYSRIADIEEELESGIG